MPSRILDRIQGTACELFSRTGYAGTSTMTIAKAADVTEGSIFRLFGNKAGLWKRCLAQRVAESFSAEAFARSLKGESFDERIRRGIAHLWKTPKSADVRLVNYAMLETPDLARETYSREINVINATIAEMIETERKHGRIRPDVETDAAAEMLLLSVFRIRFLAACHQPQPGSLGSVRANRQILDRLLDVWFQGKSKQIRSKSRGGK